MKQPNRRECGARALTLAIVSLVLSVANERAAVAKSSIEDLQRLLAADEFEEALDAAEQALLSSPDDPGIRLVAATAAIELGREKVAKAHLERARAIDPKRPFVAYQFGLLAVREAKGQKSLAGREARYAEAARWFEAELEVNPGLVRALSSRAQALVGAGRMREARSAVEDWAKADPGNREPWLAVARLLLESGEAAAVAGLPELLPPEEFLRRARVRWFLTAFLLRRGESAGARRALDRLANEDPRAAERAAAASARDALGGKFDSAPQAFGRLLRERDDDPFSDEAPLWVLGRALIGAPKELRLPFAELEQPADRAQDESLKTQPGRSSAPELIRKTQPTYPEIARTKGWEGRVVLETVITRHGRCIPFRVLESSRSQFLEPAVDAVSGWLYDPARVDGVAADTFLVVEVRFRLRS